MERAPPMAEDAKGPRDRRVLAYGNNSGSGDFPGGRWKQRSAPRGPCGSRPRPPLGRGTTATRCSRGEDAGGFENTGPTPGIRGPVERDQSSHEKSGRGCEGPAFASTTRSARYRRFSFVRVCPERVQSSCNDLPHGGDQGTTACPPHWYRAGTV